MILDSSYFTDQNDKWTFAIWSPLPQYRELNQYSKERNAKECSPCFSGECKVKWNGTLLYSYSKCGNGQRADFTVTRYSTVQYLYSFIQTL